MDFTHNNAHYESTANERQILGGEPLTSPDWRFTQPGRYHFRLFAGVGPSKDYSLVHIYDQRIWHVNMHSIHCLDSRAFPDPSGARCQCVPGYAPPEPCSVGDQHCACYSCKSEYSENHISVNGRSCETCPHGETADEDGTNCVCSRGFYNSTHLGVVSCVHDEFESDAFKLDQPAQYKKFSAFHARGEKHAGQIASACLECPSDCLDCLNTQEPTVKQGYALSTKQLSSTDHTVDCDLELQDGSKLSTKCLSILRCRPDILHTHTGVADTDDKFQCIGGLLKATSMPCSPGYEGQLCGSCSDGYGREHGNRCVNCNTATDPWTVFFVVLLIVVIAAVGFSVILFVRTKIPDRLEPEFLPSAELEEGLFEHSNPVMEQDGEGNVGKRQRETGEAAAQRQQGRLEVAGTVMRSVIFVGLQPIKIGMLKRASHPPYAHTLFLLHNKQKV